MRPAALGTRTYVRMYGRTCVGVLTFQLRASLAQPQRVPRSPEISPIMYVRTYVPKAWGTVVHARKNKQTHARTHTHKRVFVAMRNESSAVAWLIASKTSDARMAELVHKNSPTVKPYVPTRVKRGSEAPPPAGSSGLTRPQCPPCPLHWMCVPLTRGHRVRPLRRCVSEIT